MPDPKGHNVRNPGKIESNMHDPQWLLS